MKIHLPLIVKALQNMLASNDFVVVWMHTSAGQEHQIGKARAIEQSDDCIDIAYEWSIRVEPNGQNGTTANWRIVPFSQTENRSVRISSPFVKKQTEAEIRLIEPGGDDFIICIDAQRVLEAIKIKTKYDEQHSRS